MLETGWEEVESRLKGIGTDGRRRKLMDLKNGGCTDRRWMGALGQQMTGLGISWYFKRDCRVYKEEPDTAWECGITKYHSDFGREVGTFYDVWRRTRGGREAWWSLGHPNPQVCVEGL
jgi:hypothetical protein